MLVQIGSLLINLQSVTYIEMQGLPPEVHGYVFHYIGGETMQMLDEMDVHAFSAFLAGLKFGVGQVPNVRPQV